MKHHEREFFVCMIRNGKLKINQDNIVVYIHPPTLDQLLESCLIYNEAYDKAYSDEMMTEDDINCWMKENGIWTLYDDNLEDQYKKNLEELKIEIFNMRNEEKKVKRIKSLIRESEYKLLSHSNKKHVYYQNTCEGIAHIEKLSWLIKNTTYSDNKLYNFDEISLQYVTDEWQSSFLSDTKLRDIARNDPWKSLWVIRENSKNALFNNPPNTELTHNQKNLLIWSQMYDNIQESVDCPVKEVIEDDDMLDGWFIIQNRKRDAELLNKDFENDTKNEKIKTSSEVFVVASDEKRIKSIENMNSDSAKMIKKQRNLAITQNKEILEQDLPDKKIEIELLKVNSKQG
jgi:hypothetical protein